MIDKKFKFKRFKRLLKKEQEKFLDDVGYGGIERPTMMSQALVQLICQLQNLANEIASSKEAVEAKV